MSPYPILPLPPAVVGPRCDRNRHIIRFIHLSSEWRAHTHSRVVCGLSWYC